jgi:thioredoxin reductase (NADPH)
MNNSIYDVIIIGAGPIGIACGITAKNNNLSHLIIEKGCLVNSLYNYPINMSFFSSSERLEIEEIPFVTTNPKPKRAEALEYYRRVHDKYHLNTQLFEEVLTCTKVDGIFHIHTAKGQYQAKNVIVATGFYDIPMYLNIHGEDLPKVSHYYNDPHYYAGQRVVVVGASNSSIDAALETYRKGAKVSLVIRGTDISHRVKYWVRPDILNRIDEGAIDVYYESQLAEIRANEVVIRSKNRSKTIPNDFVLALTGYRPNFELLKKFNINIPETGARIPEHNPATMETNIEGLYLAGVVCGGLNTHIWFIENSRIHAKIIVDSIMYKG